MNIGFAYHQPRIQPFLNAGSQAQKKPSTLTFQGEKTTLLASQRLFHPYKLIKLLKEDDTPYLGHVPDIFLKRTGLDENALYGELDQLATSLKHYQTTQTFCTNLKRLLQGESLDTLEVRRGDRLFWQPKGTSAAPLKLVKLGKGSFGTVYKVGEGPSALAIKIYGNFASPYSAAEGASVGLFLGARNIKKDVCEFHAANPYRNWGLMEYISYESARNRSGIQLRDADLEMADDHERNYVFNVRIDHNVLGRLGSGRYRELFSSSTRTHNTSLLWLFESLTPGAYRDYS